MSTPLSPEQQVFFAELQSLEIPDEIATVIALSTNWEEIISWDENKELWRLATIIWETGLLETTPSAARMAKKIRNKDASMPLSPEQQVFFAELQSLEVPDEIATVIAHKTNWREIIAWDEKGELWRLVNIIWQRGRLISSATAMKMAKEIRKKALDTIFTLPKKKNVEAIIPNFTVQELAEMDAEELTQLWWQVREVLDARDPNELTDDEKNYLIMAIFYTEKEE